MPENPFRLPRSVIPAHYDLLLEPDLGTFTFDGRVSIRIDITETLEQIVFNAAEIDIKTMTLSGDEGETAVTGVTYDDEYARATLTLERPVAPGAYRSTSPTPGSSTTNFAACTGRRTGTRTGPST